MVQKLTTAVFSEEESEVESNSEWETESPKIKKEEKKKRKISLPITTDLAVPSIKSPSFLRNEEKKPTGLSLMDVVASKETLATSESMMWKLEDKYLAKCFLLLRKGQGVQYLVKRIDGYTIEIVASGTLLLDEVKALSKIWNVPETMLEGWFPPWIKQTLIRTEKQLASPGVCVMSTESLDVYEFSLVK